MYLRVTVGVSKGACMSNTCVRACVRASMIECMRVFEGEGEWVCYGTAVCVYFLKRKRLRSSKVKFRRIS